MQKGPAEKGVAVGVDLRDAHKRHWDFALVLGDGGVADADKKKDAHKLEKKLKKGHDKIHKGLKKAGLDFTWPPVTLSNETKCIYVTASTERLMQEVTHPAAGRVRRMAVNSGRRITAQGRPRAHIWPARVPRAGVDSPELPDRRL